MTSNYTLRMKIPFLLFRRRFLTIKLQISGEKKCVHKPIKWLSTKRLT